MLSEGPSSLNGWRPSGAERRGGGPATRCTARPRRGGRRLTRRPARSLGREARLEPELGRRTGSVVPLHSLEPRGDRVGRERVIAAPPRCLEVVERERDALVIGEVPV